MAGNRAEMAHFAALAASWWNPRGPQRILHKMNNMRMDFINGVLQAHGKPARALRALDVGCGGGLLSESLARSPYVRSVVGCDVTPEVLAVARAHQQHDAALTNLQYELQGVNELAPSGDFDVVTLFEVLEHLDDPRDGLRRAMGACRPGGHLFLSTINRTAASYLSTIALGEHVLGIVPPGTHTWSKYINRAELAREVAEHGDWAVEKTAGCVYVPLAGWVQFSPESDGALPRALDRLIGTDGGNYVMALHRLR